MGMSMDNFELFVQELPDGIAIISVKGYFQKEAGLALKEKLLPILKAGTTRIVVDFTLCELINSPGVAQLLWLVLRISEDFLGKPVFFGLSPLISEVFTMAGVLPIAQQAPDRERALALVIHNSILK